MLEYRKKYYFLLKDIKLRYYLFLHKNYFTLIVMNNLFQVLE